MNQVKLISVKSPYTWLFLLGTLNFLGGWLLLIPGGIHRIEFAGGDAAGYIEAGKYLWINFKLHYFRTFGYAIFSGLPFGFGASNELGRYLLVSFNGILFISTALLLYNIMHRVTGIKVYAFILSLVYIFSPGLIFINYTTLPEPLFIFSIVLSIRFLVIYRSTKNPEDLLWFGLIALFSACIKPENIYFSILICTIILFAFVRYSMGLRNIALLLLGILVLVVIPIFGMKKEYGMYTYSNSIKSILYHNTCSYAASNGINRNLMYDSFMNNVIRLDTTANPIAKSDINWIIRDSLYSAVLSHTWKHKKPELLNVWLSNLKENSTQSSRFISDKNVKSVFIPFAKFLRKISTLQNVVFSILAILLFAYTVFFTLISLFQRKALSNYIVRLFIVLQVVGYMAFGSFLYGYGDAISLATYALVLLLLNDIILGSNNRTIKKIVHD